MQEPRSVVVYSRKGCHLCEVVKESLAKLSRRGGFTWREIDVDGKPYMLAITPDGLKLTEKGKRKGQELSWKNLLAGQAAQATVLTATAEESADSE